MWFMAAVFWAVRHTGQNVTLARCLVEVAGWMKTEPRQVAAVGMAEHGSPLVRRVERLLSGKARAELSRNWKLAAVSLLLLGVIVTAPSVTVNATRTSLPETNESPKSANNWVSSASTTYSPFYRQDESWLTTPVPDGDVGSRRRLESGPHPEHRSMKRPKRVRQSRRAPLSRVVLRIPPEPDSEPFPAPALVVVPEPSERHAVVFTVEAPVAPIRVRLDRLVVELERLNCEIECSNLRSHVPMMEVLALHQKEILPRLLELRERLHESGTLRLEVLAPVEEAEIKNLIRLKTIEEKIHENQRRIRIRKRTPVIRI